MVRHSGGKERQMSRFFVTQDKIGDRMIHMDDRGDLKHMTKVLRLRPGDEVDIADGQMWEYRARIEEIGEDYCELLILDKQKNAAEPETRITLYQGIPKQGKMETIVQKTVELGVFRIVPVFMDRTVVVDRGGFHKKIERWQKVAAEAVKQCRRVIIPEVGDAVRMPEALREAAGSDLVLIPYENEEKTTLRQVLTSIPDREEIRSIAVFIGPEGGFSDKEIEAAEAAGARSVTLGKTILRTETAGVAAVAMIMYEMEMEK